MEAEKSIPEEEPETQELQKPDKETVLAAREVALDGMTEEEIEQMAIPADS